LENVIDYIRAHKGQHLDDLFEILKIPSISTDSQHQPDIQLAAQWMRNELERIGMENAQVIETDGNPVVYADWLHAGESRTTILIYGHYDVQPVDPEDKWITKPFEPTIRDGKIFARGAADDKGQAMIHVKALESILSVEGKLPINVKVLLEGEEEIGSPRMESFVSSHKELLSADSVLLSDTEFFEPGKPQIYYAMRGLTTTEVRITGPKQDLHSGVYGGTVHNAAQIVAEIAAALHDENGVIQIPGFYDRVKTYSAEERNVINSLPYTHEMWEKGTGLSHDWGEPDYTLLERMGIRPTAEVNGIWGGFTGEGTKTIIPASAGVKISMRLVPHQEPDEIGNLFREWVQGFIPEGYTADIEILAGGWWLETPIDSPEIRAAMAAYKAVWGADTLFSRSGGTIAIIAMIQRELGMHSVMMGFGLPDDNIHAPNERFAVDYFHKGIETVVHYYYLLAEMSS